MGFFNLTPLAAETWNTRPGPARNLRHPHAWAGRGVPDFSKKGAGPPFVSEGLPQVRTVRIPGAKPTWHTIPSVCLAFWPLTFDLWPLTFDLLRSYLSLQFKTLTGFLIFFIFNSLSFIIYTIEPLILAQRIYKIKPLIWLFPGLVFLHSMSAWIGAVLNPVCGLNGGGTQGVPESYS